MRPRKCCEAAGVPADFESGQPLRLIHRRLSDTDLYFVANPQPAAFDTTCAFRVTGKMPEFWWPETGRIEPAAVWESRDGVTRVSVPFGPSGSVFVVFRQPAAGADPVLVLKRDGKPVLSAAPEPRVKTVITRARYGVLDDPQRTRDVTAKVQDRVDSGESSFPVSMLAASGDPAPDVVKTLIVDYTIDGRAFTVSARDPETIHVSREPVKVTVEKARYGVLDDPKRTRDLREKLQRWFDAGVTRFKVADLAQGDDPAFLVVKTLDLEITRDGRRETLTGQDPDTIDLVSAVVPPQPLARLRTEPGGQVVLEASTSGDYEWVTAAGKAGRATVAGTAPAIQIAGPWEVKFQTHRGAPPAVTLDELISWSAHTNAGVKYFSGEASYQSSFAMNAQPAGANPKWYLDLGRVAVMARVSLNGKDLGTLWKPPYRVDVSSAIRPGENRLEIQVVNLWPNRLIGDEQLPEDSDRNPNGTLKAWPQWLLDGQPSPTGRITFTSWRLWKKAEPLRESGLLGPVQIVPVPVVAVK